MTDVERITSQIEAARGRLAGLVQDRDRLELEAADALARGRSWSSVARDRVRGEIEHTELAVAGLQRRLQAAQDAATLEEGRVLRERRAGAVTALGAQETVTMQALDGFERELAALGEVWMSAKRLGAPPVDPGRGIRARLEAIVRQLKNKGLGA